MNKLIMKNRKLKNRKGFTLIELIVVIAILGILSAVLVPQLGGFTDKAKQAQVLTDAAALATAADALLVEKGGTLPSATEIEELAGITGVDTLAKSGNIVTFKYTPSEGKAVFRHSDGSFKETAEVAEVEG